MANTVIIFGNGRSGTSLLAFIVARLGYALIRNSHPLKHESSPLAYDKLNHLDLKQSRASIDDYNSMNSHWAWKSPRDIFLINEFIHLVRNPIVLISHRNPIDIFCSASNKEGLKPDIFFNDYAIFFNEVVRLVESPPCPVVHVTFESLVNDPLQSIYALAKNLGLSDNAELFNEIAESIFAGKSYQSLSKSGAQAIDQDDLLRDSLAAVEASGVPYLKRRLLALSALFVDSINAVACLRSATLPRALLDEADKNMYNLISKPMPFSLSFFSRISFRYSINILLAISF